MDYKKRCNICGTELIEFGDMSYCPKCTFKNAQPTRQNIRIKFETATEETEKKLHEFMTYLYEGKYTVDEFISYAPVIIALAAYTNKLSDRDITELLMGFTEAFTINYKSLKSSANKNV